MSEKALKKIRKWYRAELKTEAFKNHNMVWEQINNDLQKRLSLYRKALAGILFLYVVTVVVLILWR
jgi:hypothetical protein